MANRQTSFADPNILYGSQLESELNELHSNIDNSNIASDANIDISKTALGTYTAWTTYTPTLTQSTTITKTITSARYCQIGKMVFGQIYLAATGNGVGNNAVTVTLPVTAALTSAAIGSGYYYNDDVPLTYGVTAQLINATTFGMVAAGYTGASLGVAPNFTVNAPDAILINFCYEAA